MSRPSLLLRAVLPLVALVPLFAGCPEPEAGGVGKSAGPRSEKATQWMKRAGEELSALDLDEAAESIGKAQKMAPGDPEIAVLAGRIQLARLDFAAAAKALEGVDGSEAAGLRARAFWYGDDLSHAAEELSRALEDPSFKDSWAKPVRDLAGTQGTGRKPFLLKDNSARVIEMRMPRDLGTLMLIPCEIDGQATVALIDTGVPEVILDQKSRSSPGWVSFRFASLDGARSMEFRDVPAFVQDLSPFTKGQTVPVGAVIGVNFLRRLHITFDRLADQLVLRREDPPAPPAYSKVPLGYYNGGGMLVRGTIQSEFELSSGLWLNSGVDVALAFPDSIWTKIGVNPKNLPSNEGKTVGRLKDLRLGPLDLGPADANAALPQLDEALGKFKGIDVMGQAGMNFLTAFRVTIGDKGRALWVETDQNTPLVLAPAQAGAPKAAATTAPASSTAPVPKTSSSPVTSAVPATSGKPAPAASTKPATKPAASAAPKPAASAAPKPAASAGKK